MIEFYVYIHYTIDTNEPFYVGKGKGNRAWKTCRTKYWENIVAKHGLRVEIKYSQLDEPRAFIIEKELIKNLRAYGYQLCNLTDGGEGCSGLHHTEDTIHRMRNAHLGNTGNLGHKASEETREKLKQQRLGNTYAKGLKHSDETKAKMSLASLGNKHRLGSHVSDETKAKMSLARKGHKVSEETRQKMRLSALAYLEKKKLLDTEREL